ncbi:MAG: prefoldin subunit beta [archaeon]|nr:MAG: prefoldin subunit beta [archaeon]
MTIQNPMEQLQLAEQNMQNITLQKQVFQMELVETNNALEELKNVKNEEVFKVVGSVMVKTDKKKVTEDLKKKSQVLDLRMKALEKQEEDLKQKIIKIRSEILKKTKVEKK